MKKIPHISTGFVICLAVSGAIVCFVILFLLWHRFTPYEVERFGNEFLERLVIRGGKRMVHARYSEVDALVFSYRSDLPSSAVISDISALLEKLGWQVRFSSYGLTGDLPTEGSGLIRGGIRISVTPMPTGTYVVIASWEGHADLSSFATDELWPEWEKVSGRIAVTP